MINFRPKLKYSQNHSVENGIETVVKGGIGNQLFRISQAIDMSIRLKRPLKFNTNSFKRDTWQRESTLGRLGLPENTWLNFERNEDAIVFTNPKNVNFSRPLKLIVEEFHFIDIDFPVRPFVIDGYFQSPKYFEKNLVPIKSFLKNEICKSTDIIKFSNVPTFHIRGGDYLNQQVSKVMNLDRAVYLRNACELLGNPVRINLVSDDKKYAESLMKKSLPNSEINWVGTFNLFDDFVQIMLSSEIVISNSTFSWWAAFLSDSKNIVAPKEWFTLEVMKKTNIKDLFPEKWNLI